MRTATLFSFAAVLALGGMDRTPRAQPVDNMCPQGGCSSCWECDNGILWPEGSQIHRTSGGTDLWVNGVAHTGADWGTCAGNHSTCTIALNVDKQSEQYAQDLDASGLGDHLVQFAALSRYDATSDSWVPSCDLLVEAQKSGVLAMSGDQVRLQDAT